MARNQTLARRLGRVPVFQSLSSDQLNTLAAAARRVEVASREVIFEQGAMAYTCVVVLKGIVQFRVRLGSCTATAGMAVENDIFGLEALRKKARRQESALPAGAVDLVEVETPALKAILLDNPHCQLDVLDYVVAKLQGKAAQAVRNSHQDAERRIAAYLIDQTAHRVPRDPKTWAALSQAELADYLALTPETFCRKINKFRRLGWISGSGNEYVVTNPDALRHLLER